MVQPEYKLLKPRRATRAIYVGNVQVGGGAPVSVQSMTNTDTHDIDGTLAQIDRLIKAGCEIVRLAVPGERAVKAFGKIKAACAIPVIADIHFNHRLALGALEVGPTPCGLIREIWEERRRPGWSWTPAGIWASLCVWGECRFVGGRPAGALRRRHAGSPGSQRHAVDTAV